jgi:alpha-D-ribose 1-methylphosphonate 5-triphosphate synthase subunit PhnG
MANELELMSDDIEQVPTRLSDGNAALAALVRSEVDGQVATAKRYPRDVIRCLKRIQTLATMDEETAASCFYTLPRGGKTVQGESIRLAELVLANYQNIRAGTRIVEVCADEAHPHVTIQAVAYDVENNASVTVEKRRRITPKKEWQKDRDAPPKYKAIDEDDIQLAVNACSSIALRDAIFRIIPKAIIRPIYLATKKVAVGDASTLANKRADVIDRLKKMGITQDRIFAAIEVTRIEEVDLDKLEALIGFGTAIREGELTIDRAFPEVATTGGKVGESNAAARFGKKAADADTVPKLTAEKKTDGETKTAAGPTDAATNERLLPWEAQISEAPTVGELDRILGKAADGSGLKAAELNTVIEWTKTRREQLKQQK